nr:RING finger protein 157-like isoform X1 [Microcebus murinus]
MGALTSRQHAGVEEVDIPSNSVYRYPPKSGSYFANHFIMGGEKFDSTHPEGYLFGENSDLNFLGNRPVAIFKSVQMGAEKHCLNLNFLSFLQTTSQNLVTNPIYI